MVRSRSSGDAEVRPTCRTCDARLASDNPDDLCGPCQSRHRHEPPRPPTVPSDFWDHPEMRAALEDRHMGRVLRAYREHPHHGRRGISQAEVARWATLTQGWISQFETGQPLNQLGRLIDWAQLLGIPQERLWFDLPSGLVSAPRELPSEGDHGLLLGDAPLGGLDSWMLPIGDTPNGDCEGALSMAEERARAFGRRFGNDGLNDEALEQLHDDIASLVFDYQRQPLTDLLGDLGGAQDAVFSSLELVPPPTQARKLFFLGGVVSGVLAKACHDFVNSSGAMVHTRTGFLCADRADHNGLRAWIRGLQSQISYWAGRPHDALRYAQTGAAFAAKSANSMSVWLPACEARAWAVLGNSNEALSAIQRAEAAMDAVRTDELDTLGGLCWFGPTRQLYYASDALAWLTDEASRAESYASRAVDAYKDVESPEWAFGDQAGSYANLALSRIARGEREGAAEALRPLLSLPPGLRINGVINSAMRVHESLRQSEIAAASAELQEEIEVFTRTSLPALPAGGA